MRIEYKNNTTPFENLCGGLCFTYDGKAFIRISTLLAPDTGKVLFNAVDLSTGTPKLFENFNKVTPVNAKVVIE